MAPDDNGTEDTEFAPMTPELKRLLEAVRNFSPEKKRRLLERAGLKSEIISRYPMNPPPEEPK